MANIRPRPYKTSELKTRITNLAQTSVYQIKIQPPSGLTNLLKEINDGNFDNNRFLEMGQNQIQKTKLNGVFNLCHN